MNNFKSGLRRLGFNYVESIRRKFSGLGLREIYIVRKLYNFLFSRLRPDFVEIDGIKIYSDPMDVLSISKPQNRESSLVWLFEKEIKRGDVVLDLGAHIGYYTLLAAKLTGPTGKVFSFEPSPSNFELLKKNVEANDLANVVIEQKGIADKNGQLEFFLYGTLTNSWVSCRP